MHRTVLISLAGLFTVASLFDNALSYAQDEVTNATAPHVRRQGPNLVPNSTVAGESTWSLFGDAKYDATLSRTDDGSGCFQLLTPIPEGSKVFSEFIPIESSGKYTFAFLMRTENGPTIVGGQVSVHDRDKRYLRNLPSGRGGTSADGHWQEFALPVFVPEEAAYVRVQAYKCENTRDGGRVQVDELYFGKGIGLQQPPAPKRGFAGEHVRIDSLGNFEIKRDGQWIPFFPFCMYCDNYRDWSLYSKQGWNTIIWTGAAHQVQQAKEAVSEFNPDGMLAGYEISRYTFPPHPRYNDLNHLRTNLQEVFDKGLDDRLLLYYWDNENHHDQWQVPADVIDTIRRMEISESGKRLHPIYALQGSMNVARTHAAKGLVDVSGTYVGGGASATGGAGLGDYDGLLLLDRLEQQVSPAAFAQFNSVEGLGDMRLRLYNSIILGAKAVGYWRDCFHESCRREFPDVKPIEQQEWWPDFPNLRREVDELLPLIRTPHWTNWTAKVDAPQNVRVGTRDLDDVAHLILVNQTGQSQTITISLTDLPYPASGMVDILTGERVAPVRDNSCSITLPKLGAGSGTQVLRIVGPVNRD